MLPAAYRMRSASDFALAIRRGRRVRSGSVVVHLLSRAGDTELSALTPSAEVAPSVAAESRDPARVGLVVGKSVGGSVARHHVSRKLRAQLAERLEQVPPGSRLVVRALPETATASSRTIGRDLDQAFYRLLSGAK
jgi:ribonuclease P protein component